MEKPGSAYGAAMKKKPAAAPVNVAAARQHVANAMAEPDMAKKQAHLQSAHMALGGTMPDTDMDND